MADDTQDPDDRQGHDPGAPQGLELWLEERDPNTRYLGDPSDVEAIVREFLAEIHEANSAFEEGVASGSDTEAALKEIVPRYAAIFEGKAEGYKLISGFNTPLGVGRAILRRHNFDATPEDACETLLWTSAKSLIEAADAYAKGELSDEKAIEAQAMVVDDCASALLGLPPGISLSGLGA